MTSFVHIRLFLRYYMYILFLFTFSFLLIIFQKTEAQKRIKKYFYLRSKLKKIAKIMRKGKRKRDRTTYEMCGILEHVINQKLYIL